jgi:hypothetical protein
LLALYVRIASSCVAMESRNCLHRVIVCSVGADCCNASALRAGRSPSLTPRARKRKTPQTSWIIFYLHCQGGGSVFWFPKLLLCSIGWFDVGVRLVLRFVGGRMTEAFKRFAYVVRHGEVHFSALVVPLQGESAIPFGFPIARAFVKCRIMSNRCCASSSLTYFTPKLLTTKLKLMGCVSCFHSRELSCFGGNHAAQASSQEVPGQ